MSFCACISRSWNSSAVIGCTREPSGLRPEKAAGSVSAPSSVAAFAIGVRANAEAAAVLSETAPRSSKDRIQIWLVHDSKRFILARAQVVKINEKLAQTKKKAEVPLPRKNRSCVTPNSTADSTS